MVPKSYPHRFVILAVFMFLTIVIQIRWLAHAAVARPASVFYAAEVSYPAPESASQSILLWVGQITGLIFVAGMSFKNYEYLGAFMTAFSLLSLVSLMAVLLLKESPMMNQKEPFTY